MTYPQGETIKGMALRYLGLSRQSSTVDPDDVIAWINDGMWEFQVQTDHYRTRTSETFTAGVLKLTDPEPIELVKLVSAWESDVKQRVIDYDELEALKGASATFNDNLRRFALNVYPTVSGSDKFGTVEIETWPALASTAVIVLATMPPEIADLGDDVLMPAVPIARYTAWQAAEMHKPQLVDYNRAEFYRHCGVLRAKRMVPGAAQIAGVGGFLATR